MRKWLYCLLLATGLYAEEPSYVTCVIAGQLGNQLFQISTALATAWEHGATPVFPQLKRGDWNIPLTREKIFFRLQTEAPDLQWNSFHLWGFDGNGAVYYQPIEYSKNLFLDGWNWLTYYFDPYKERLMETFAPSDEEEAIIQAKYGELIRDEKAVAVHIRASHPDYGRFIGLNYFKKAMDLFPRDSTFVIFSDRIQWAKKRLSGTKPNLVFIEGNDHVRDFFLLNKFKRQIISNSTYSFWAAYLNNDPEQIVIAPDLYIPTIERFSVEKGSYPKHWKVLTVSRESLNIYWDIKRYPTTNLYRDH